MGARQGGQAVLCAKYMGETSTEIGTASQASTAEAQATTARNLRPEELVRSRMLDWTPRFVPRTRERRLKPMSKADVESHAKSLGLSASGIEYVISAIDSPPARKVRNPYRTNRIGEIHEYVQGSFADISEARIQTESDGERAFAEIVSSNPSTLILLDQPKSVSVACTDSIGRRQLRKITADFLLVMSDQVVVVEVKPLEALQKQLDRRPDLWSFRDGKFSFIPAEAQFRSLGIGYEVVPTETIPWVLARNLLILENVPIPTTGPEQAQLKSIQRAVHRLQPTSIEEVIEVCNLELGVPVLQAIIQQAAYVDLTRCCLWEPSSSTICSTLDRAIKIGIAIEQRDLVLQRGQGVAEQLFNPRYMEKIGFRLATLNGQAGALFPGADEVSERTVQRWRKRYEKDGLPGLAPKSENAGRPRSITDQNIDIAILQIAKDRSSGNGTSIEKSHENYCGVLKDMKSSSHGCPPMSLSSYKRLWHSRDHNRVDALKAGGKRAGNADAGRVAMTCPH